MYLKKKSCQLVSVSSGFLFLKEREDIQSKCLIFLSRLLLLFFLPKDRERKIIERERERRRTSRNPKNNCNDNSLIIHNTGWMLLHLTHTVTHTHTWYIRTIFVLFCFKRRYQYVQYTKGGTREVERKKKKKYFLFLNVVFVWVKLKLYISGLFLNFYLYTTRRHTRYTRNVSHKNILKKVSLYGKMYQIVKRKIVFAFLDNIVWWWGYVSSCTHK